MTMYIYAWYDDRKTFYIVLYHLFYWTKNDKDNNVCGAAKLPFVASMRVAAKSSETELSGKILYQSNLMFDTSIHQYISTSLLK